jgi:hypothetical protein
MSSYDAVFSWIENVNITNIIKIKLLLNLYFFLFNLYQCNTRTAHFNVGIFA